MLKYENLLPVALDVIPEFKAEYRKYMDSDEIDEETGNHIVFSYAFVPVLTKAIREGNHDLVTRMLSFVEQMALSNDKLVGEVCDFTILEELNDAIDDAILIPLLGKTTREDFFLMKQYME